MNKITVIAEEERQCLECGEQFYPEYEEQLYCSDECEYDNENSEWRKSQYHRKDISNWSVDDHLAAWYDDMMEK